jgi:Flp pilus assembly pilin Flp
MMTVVVKRLVLDEVGQDLAEYGIALAIIGVIAAAAAIVIAKDVGTLWSRAQSVIDSAATAS